MAGEITPDIYKNNNIFSKLKRLFSTDVIIRNVGGDNITVLDTNKIQVSGEIETNALHDRYNRLYTTNSNPLYNFNANYPTLRLNLYQDYEMMDTDPIIASTLDIISDESTLKDDLNDVLSIKSSDEDIQKLLYNLFYDVLNIEFNLWSWIRQMCKFGDFFLKLEIAEKFGVFNVIPFSAYNITREEGYDKDKPSSIRFRYDPTGNLGASGYMGGMYSDMVNKDAYYFDNYEMAHFRLLADSNYLPYGRSYIEPARKAYKQMALMEDAMLIHRIVRAPERRIFYINVGSIPPADVEAFMEKTISKMKRTPYVDPQTGEYNLKYNMENLLEDFFIPVRGGDSTTKLDTAPGLAYDGIKDVEYLRDKMMTALKVPKAFFGYDANLCISPETTIPLLDGRILKVKDIINEYNEGKINYVYSIDEKTKNIVPGEIEWAGFTRMNTQTIKVWLDNEKFIQCTPDHLFMTRDGEWKEAQNLQEGESLMPLYLEKSKEKKINGYTKVYNPNNGKFEFVHRLVANYFNLKENGKEKVIHHIDCNKLNNNPENLNCSMDFWEHRKWHLKHNQLCHTPEANNKRKNTWINMMKNPKLLKNAQERCRQNSKKLVEWIKQNGASRKGVGKETNYNCQGCNKDMFHKGSGDNIYKHLYCSKECRTKNNTQKNKFKNVSLDQLINLSSNCKNFKELMVLLNIKDHSTLTRIFNNLNINKSEFIINYMPLSHTNFRFMSQFKETNKFYLENQYNYKNHKVLRIEFVEDKIDTCDLTIKNYHNFGTEAGIIIHNSGKATLAAEDIRFARTIERIQRIVTSELYKIAFIHLYTQGYRGEELSNFELSLTTPSIIYDQEKIALLKEKVDLAKNIMEAKLLPKDWIYDNIFHYSEDQFDEYKDLIIQDAKDEFRLKQIGDEGNDPLESGKSYGTPHDLASLYGKGRYTTNNSVPKGYDKDEPGRPTEKASYVGTQKDPLGKDRIGKSDYKDIGPEDNRFRNRKKGPNPLALEGKYKVLLESMQNNKKINIYDKEKDINFLNENNIL
jgi:hypothetical protein